MKPAARVRKIREDVPETEEPAAPAPSATAPTDEEPAPPAGQQIIEGIRISQKATHWRIERQRETGKGERLYYGVKPTGAPCYQWPLAELSTIAIQARWGGGNYRVRFVGYDETGKPFQAGYHPWVVVGDPKVPLDDDEDDGGAGGVGAPDAHALIMKGIEMQQTMQLRSAEAARIEMEKQIAREQADHQRRIERERADAEQQLNRERARAELDMREREQRWAREREEVERKARGEREAPEKFKDALLTGVREAVEPLQAKIAELEEKLEEATAGAGGDDDGEGGGLGTVKKVDAWIGVIGRIFGGIFENEELRNFVTRVAEGAAKGAAAAAQQGGAGGGQSGTG